ncbi:mitochondrial glycine transporter A-like [Tachypleus tridentatus]|uniref:mitochondrial glycine transporter A-like n=1 Tax=Tachypleus tridentatus TaxID=6853 RepID=UPI003FD3D8B5
MMVDVPQIITRVQAAMIASVHRVKVEDMSSHSEEPLGNIKSPVVKSFLAGSLNGMCSSLLFQPLDLVKTRLQNSKVSSGMGSVFNQVARSENVFGLWRGIVLSIIRCVPGIGLYFSSLNWLEIFMSNICRGDPSFLEAACLGITARCFAGVTLLPVTVVKIRFESGIYNYGSVVEAVRVIHKTEGIKGLFSGLLPTLLWDAPFSGIYLMFYTQTKKMISYGWKEGMTRVSVTFFNGLLAGVMALVLTQPADVIKTYMQLYPEQFEKSILAVKYIYQEYGMKGYFKGLAPRVL